MFSKRLTTIGRLAAVTGATLVTPLYIGVAQAITLFDFDLTVNGSNQTPGGGTPGTSFTYTEIVDGVELNLEVTSFLGSISDANQVLVNPTPNGLAVSSPGEGPAPGVAPGNLDGDVPTGEDFGEILLLDFGETVTLTGASFFTGGNPAGGGANNDNFTLLVDGQLAIDQLALLPANTPSFAGLTFTGQQFAFTATDNNDNFDLSGVSVEVPFEVESSALLGTVVVVSLGLAYRRRKRSRLDA